MASCVVGSIVSIGYFFLHVAGCLLGMWCPRNTSPTCTATQHGRRGTEQVVGRTDGFTRVVMANEALPDGRGHIEAGDFVAVCGMTHPHSDTLRSSIV